MQAAATTRAGKSHTQVGNGWTGSLRKPSTKVETGEEGTAGKGGGEQPHEMKELLVLENRLPFSSQFLLRV